MRHFRTLSILAFCTIASGFAIAADTMAPNANPPMDTKASVNPGATLDIIQTATGANMEEVTTLVAAVKAAGLVDTLKGAGPFTVLAPTNEAFKKLPAGTVEDLLKPENKAKLVKILTYHVIPANADAKTVMGMTSAKSVEGGTVKIMTKDGKVMVGNDKAMATVIKTDVKATNGTIHWIDTVLMPE